MGGWWADAWWTPDRKGTPWVPDRLHWLVGYALVILAFVTVYYGLDAYYGLPDWAEGHVHVDRLHRRPLPHPPAHRRPGPPQGRRRRRPPPRRLRPPLPIRRQRVGPHSHTHTHTYTCPLIDVIEATVGK